MWQTMIYSRWLPSQESEQHGLDALLNEGWEPFGVTYSPRGRYDYHLRRFIDVIQDV